MPKRRAASRWLSPSTWQAWQTRPYSSTENIPALSGPWRASPKKAMTRYSFVPARPDYPVASVAYFSTAALKAGWREAEEPSGQRPQRDQSDGTEAEMHAGSEAGISPRRPRYTVWLPHNNR